MSDEATKLPAALADAAALRERLAWMTAYAEEQHAHAEGLKATYGTREIRELNAALRTAEALALANREARGRAEAAVAKLRVDMEEMVEAAGRHTELDARLERIANGLTENGRAIDAAVVARAERAEAERDELRGLAEEVRAELQNHALLPALQRKLRAFLAAAAIPGAATKPKETP